MEFEVCRKTPYATFDGFCDDPFPETIPWEAVNAESVSLQALLDYPCSTFLAILFIFFYFMVLHTFCNWGFKRCYRNTVSLDARGEECSINISAKLLFICTQCILYQHRIENPAVVAHGTGIPTLWKKYKRHVSDRTYIQQHLCFSTVHLVF